MSILTLKEDRPTPKAVYNWRVYLCAITASMASCAIGYDSAFIGTTLALPSFTKEFRFEDYDPDALALLKQNIVSGMVLYPRNQVLTTADERAQCTRLERSSGPFRHILLRIL